MIRTETLRDHSSCTTHATILCDECGKATPRVLVGAADTGLSSALDSIRAETGFVERVDKVNVARTGVGNTRVRDLCSRCAEAAT